MAPYKSTDFLQPINNPITSRILNFIIGFGLAAQIGLVFWPIGNYATIVYLCFYLPVLILIASQLRLIINIIKRVDRKLLFALLALLSWVSISSFYGTTTQENINLPKETLKHCLLIFLYILAVAYLSIYAPKTILFSIYLALLFAAILATATLIDRFIINETSISSRLDRLGLGTRTDKYNQVNIGIYFGCLTIISTTCISIYKNSNRLLMSLFITITLALFTITYLTGTRTALIGLIAALVFYLVFIRKKTALGIFLCLSVVSALSLSFIFNIQEVETFVLRGGLGSLRPQIWSESIKEALNHLWWGLGMGSETKLEVARDSITSIQNHSHNFYLQLLNWCGLTGLFIYISMLFKAAQLNYLYAPSHLASLSFLALSYFAIVQIFDVHNIFTSPSYYWPCIWLPIGIILGLSYKPTYTTSPKRGKDLEISAE